MDNHGRIFFPYFSANYNDRFQKLSLLTKWVFFYANIFWEKHCLIRSKTALVLQFSRLNWMISEIRVRKRIQKSIFRNYRKDYLREFDVYKDIVFKVYV